MFSCLAVDLVSWSRKTGSRRALNSIKYVYAQVQKRSFSDRTVYKRRTHPNLNNPRAHLLLEASATALNNGNVGRSWMRMGVFVASQSGMHQLG